MRRLSQICFVLLMATACHQATDDIKTIASDYVDTWVSFYPSQALSAGLAEAAFDFEDLSPQHIHGWLVFNQQALARIQALPAPASLDDEIDRRLLKRQVNRELYRWGEIEAHRTDLRPYSALINHSLTPILVRKNLSGPQRINSVISRLRGLTRLCEAAQSNLANGRPASIEAAIRDIQSTATFIEENLVSILGSTPDAQQNELMVASGETAEALRTFTHWLIEDLLPRSSLSDAYGEDQYAAELALAFGSSMTSSKLEQIASTEIHTVRELMAELAGSYWPQARTGSAPKDFGDLVLPVLADMELNRASDQQEFLQQFMDLIDRSERFLIEKDLIDIPEQRTLFTALSPSHFAGAAVGGVYSAGPFDPEAETLFYLPTVPDSAAETSRDGFYRSFNNHFNSTIITHEIYPGHYLQLKVAAYHPSRVRALFATEDFTEGWASFCEQMTLDVGWDADQPLTRMAHLRKRLENAVRAYVSVQVHCRNWDRDALETFAVNTGLLPPQFAENLWHRALLTPIQIPSYFVGFQTINTVYESERTRLGDQFSIKDFNNAIVQSGGIPLDLLSDYLLADKDS
ncbi:MAG: DUF885 domain-containing protein [bacterium]|nr:DUF885 domain-containing protein [bacterium]